MDRRAPGRRRQLEAPRTRHRQTGGVGDDDGDAFTADELLDGPLAHLADIGCITPDAAAGLSFRIAGQIDEDRVIQERHRRAIVGMNDLAIAHPRLAPPRRIAAGGIGVGPLRGPPRRTPRGRSDPRGIGRVDLLACERMRTGPHATANPRDYGMLVACGRHGVDEGDLSGFAGLSHACGLGHARIARLGTRSLL